MDVTNGPTRVDESKQLIVLETSIASRFVCVE